MAKQSSLSSFVKDFRNKYINHGSIDIWFLLVVLALLCTGLIMLFSASYPTASTSASSGYNPFYYIKRQAVFAVFGVACMLVFSMIKPEFWKKVTYLVGILSTALLLISLILPADSKGFRRWITIGPVQFQPSEITKFAVILFGAYVFDKYAKKMSSSKPSKSLVGKKVNTQFNMNLVRESWDPAWQFCIFMGMSAVLVMLEKHLSCVILIGLLGIIMLFIGGVRGRWFVAGLSVVLAAVLIVCVPIGLDVKKLQNAEEQKAAAEEAGEEFDMTPYEGLATKQGFLLKGYQRERIFGWLDKDYSPTDVRWQTNQGLYAIGSGGFFGKGLTNSTQKYSFVSEPQNDMIFSIVCEECGFVGAAIIILLFVFLVFRGVMIGLQSKTRFGMMLAMGLVFQVGIQMVLNIAVASDAMPNTGISLPFFSYGGTSLLMLLGEMGIVLSVSKDGRVKNK